MSEIRIRVWLEKYGQYSTDLRCNVEEFYDSEDGNRMMGAVNVAEALANPPEGQVLELFSGLCDKNGVKIFSGDIMEYKLCNGIRRDFVRLEQGMFGIIGPAPMYDDLPLNIALTCVHDARVVGNIHQNADMIGWVSPPIQDSPAEWAKGDR